MNPDHQNELIVTHFLQFVTEKRREKMEQVLANRTRHITLVLEDIFQAQNASAAVRTCECFGIQDIHVIEKTSQYEVNKKVLKGSNKWMTIIKHKNKNQNNTEACYKHLREEGYKIFVTDPSADGLPIGEVDIDQKIALVMGNELEGISKYALDHADQKVNIPMFGFTESFNISVSAAICLSTLSRKLRTSSINWQLSQREIQELRLHWLRKMVRRSDLLEQEFVRSIQ